MKHFVFNIVEVLDIKYETVCGYVTVHNIHHANLLNNPPSLPQSHAMEESKQ